MANGATVWAGLKLFRTESSSKCSWTQ